MLDGTPVEKVDAEGLVGEAILFVKGLRYGGGCCFVNGELSSEVVSFTTTNLRRLPSCRASRPTIITITF